MNSNYHHGRKRDNYTTTLHYTTLEHLVNKLTKCKLLTEGGGLQ